MGKSFGNRKNGNWGHYEESSIVVRLIVAGAMWAIALLFWLQQRPITGWNQPQDDRTSPQLTQAIDRYTEYNLNFADRIKFVGVTENLLAEDEAER